MEQAVLIGYFFSLSILFLFGLHGFVMMYYHRKYGHKNPEPDINFKEGAIVTIQLPLYNEMYVAERLINSVCEIDYPKGKMEIQVLDDSTDETTSIVAKAVEEKKKAGFDILHIRRGTREGYKAGALKEGMKIAKGEYIAIFDADFIPQKEFLQKTLSYFTDDKVGMVQSRWEHLNGDYSIITKAQALALDGHFVIEQTVRNRSGFFINFNGTGGVWRKKCIEEAGNWHADTLTEDLDLSYRAQLIGWRFVFLKDFTSPAELPSEINALKAQQFRWTKGAVETAKKILPLVWKSKVPLRVKLQSTFHLTNNLVFPFIVERKEDDDDAYFTDVANREPFRLGHTMKVLELSMEDGFCGIIVKVCEGRQIGSVPLFDVEVTPKNDQNFWPVREYVVWFANK